MSAIRSLTSSPRGLELLPHAGPGGDLLHLLEQAALDRHLALAPAPERQRAGRPWLGGVERQADDQPDQRERGRAGARDAVTAEIAEDRCQQLSEEHEPDQL